MQYMRTRAYPLLLEITVQLATLTLGKADMNLDGVNKITLRLGADGGAHDMNVLWRFGSNPPASNRYTAESVNSFSQPKISNFGFHRAS
eukprot:2718384-Amphidinium_carterae.2